MITLKLFCNMRTTGSISAANYQLFRTATILYLLLQFQATRAAASEQSFVTRPDECVLLLGDHTVARTLHLTQRFSPAAKHPNNPVMRRRRPGRA